MRPSDTAARARLLERGTLVLNRSWMPVHTAPVRRALCLVFREIARIVSPQTLATFSFPEWCGEPIADDTLAIRSPSLRLAAPEIVVLTRYDRVPRFEAPFTRHNLILRDDHTCQYCGRRCSSDHLSVDHVRPRSRGGTTSWENCVLACVGCNARKADRTIREAGLHLQRRPVRPRWTPCLNLRPGQRLESWEQFVPQRRTRSAECG